MHSLSENKIVSIRVQLIFLIREREDSLRKKKESKKESGLTNTSVNKLTTKLLANTGGFCLSKSLSTEYFKQDALEYLKLFVAKPKDRTKIDGFIEYNFLENVTSEFEIEMYDDQITSFYVL